MSLAEVANISDQKQRGDKFKALLEQFLAQKNKDKLKDFVVASKFINSKKQVFNLFFFFSIECWKKKL